MLAERTARQAAGTRVGMDPGEGKSWIGVVKGRRERERRGRRRVRIVGTGEGRLVGVG